MRRFIFLVAIASSLVLPGAVQAEPTAPHLSWGSHVNPARCDSDSGYRYLVLNITHHVTNDADAGIGRFWAATDYNKHIQVWEVGESDGNEGELFCALVRYQGSFESTAGDSPNLTDPDGIAAGIRGTFEGGYRAAIVGVLRTAPAYRARGRVGTFNYGWSGDPHQGAPNRFDWIETYFMSGASVSYEWWGWTYHGGSNGSWVNAITGSEGDIVD